MIIADDMQFVNIFLHKYNTNIALIFADIIASLNKTRRNEEKYAKIFCISMHKYAECFAYYKKLCRLIAWSFFICESIILIVLHSLKKSFSLSDSAYGASFAIEILMSSM